MSPVQPQQHAITGSRRRVAQSGARLTAEMERSGGMNERQRTIDDAMDVEFQTLEHDRNPFLIRPFS
jgi:hypothetical protein